MAGPKKKALPPPIDRPLSRAYVRQFAGWSTAYPPGQSEPTSCRIMENLVTERNGGLAIRPGLRYMSYAQTPDMDATENAVPGVAFDRPMVGTTETFYLNNGDRALLFAVREEDETVGFRALLFQGVAASVYPLTDPKVGFIVPQGSAALNFSSATTHVEYLQIDNKILALSDAGESVRLFLVGTEKVAKALYSIPEPQWEDNRKIVAIHPSFSWILKLGYYTTRNELVNPSFEVGTAGWVRGATCEWDVAYAPNPVAGQLALRIKSKPTRTNLVKSPLHAVDTLGHPGWYSHQKLGQPLLTDAAAGYLQITNPSGRDRFFAYSAKMEGVVPGRHYKMAFDFVHSENLSMRCRLAFFGTNGSMIGDPVEFTRVPGLAILGRHETIPIEAPPDAVTLRAYIGGKSENKEASWVKVRNVVVCSKNEDSAFFAGDSGTNFFWTGTPNASASVYHPPQNITVTSAKTVKLATGDGSTGAIYIRSDASAHSGTLTLRLFDRANTVARSASSTFSTAPGEWIRPFRDVAGMFPEKAVNTEMEVTINAVARGEEFFLDAGMIQDHMDAPSDYFDGSSINTTIVTHHWADATNPHMCASIEYRTVDPTDIPLPQIPLETTLVSSNPSKNTYKMGLFYTFENEVGESAPSKITELRMSRPQSNWLWQTPDWDDGHPSGEATEVADLCCDQITATIPEEVYESAIKAGAVKWNLYTFNWSDEDPVPVEGVLVGSRSLYADAFAMARNEPLHYKKGGWINITPARKVGIDSQMLPTRDNRVNYSEPPKARSGIVAGDRMILVGDSANLAAIHWSSNRPGEYIKFTASKGGGIKTLSSGNLNLPGTVVLWQNPQSVDTLTVLCLGTDGMSSCYYMSPGSVNAQSSSSSVMGFEETTNTPGSMSAYGVEVVNNALYRPTDRAVLKSTAQNYNINHKVITDQIANMWEGLHSKNWIMSGTLDMKIYYVVNNPRGEPLEEGCKGNEIWVHDLKGGEAGTWSRLLIQSCSVRSFEHGYRVYMGVVRPDGLYYLDPKARLDDYVQEDGTVAQRPIPWQLEFNTQGANRAHDAWAHLQQVGVTLGGFYGSMRYGIRGQTIHGQMVNVSKQFEELSFYEDDGQTWDFDDVLQVRRDLKEWFFYASSVPGKVSAGQLDAIQYRYTPVSVNVGYEYGSVETFEYGANESAGANGYSTNGIPTPMQDLSRP